MKRLGNEEYFRALESHKTLKNISEESYLPAEIVYMIDKEIRMKFRRDKEANVHSETAKVEMLKKQTSEKPTFEEWMRKKQFEMKIKKSLMMRALKNKYENDLLVEQDREEKFSEKRKRLRGWEAHKMCEINKKVLGNKALQIEKEHMTLIKRKEAEDHYREWLKGNMVKLKEEKKKKKLEKLKEKEEKMRKTQAEELLRQKTEENFKTWLKSKKKQPVRHPPNPRPIKVKKPIMLAYSPNKKHLKEPSFTDEISSFNKTPDSSLSDHNYIRQVSSKPKLYPANDELSSINLNKPGKSPSEISSSGDYDEEVIEDYEEDLNQDNYEYEDASEEDYDSSFEQAGHLSF